MPGCWEIKAANSVVVAILHTDATTIPWALGLRNLIIPGREELRRFHPVLPLSGMPYDHARNQACIHTINVGAEWLFFLDSDVIPPRDVIPRLIAHGKPLVSGVYCRRSPPVAVPVMQRDGKGWVTDPPTGGLIEVDVVGAGCLLIHRTVLERLPPSRPECGKHWFDWRVDMNGLQGADPRECMSEDFQFCRNVKRHLRIPILVDTSIQCRHVGLAQSTFGQFGPCDMTPVS